MNNQSRNEKNKEADIAEELKAENKGSSALEVLKSESGALELSGEESHMPQAKQSTDIRSKRSGSLRGKRAAELANINHEHGLKKYVAHKESFKSVFLVYLLIIAASVIRALNISIFVLPNDFAPGGVTGISAMLQFATEWSSGWFLLMLNLPLIILSMFFLGKNFAFRTLVSALTTSGLLLLLQYLEEKGFSIYEFETDSAILAALAGGIFSGCALAILLRCGSSTGGSDIIASIFHKKRPDINIGWFILILDAIVVFVSIFVYQKGIEPAILACIMIVCSSKLCNSILSGFKSAHKFEIITNEPDKVSAIIMQKLHRSVTMIPAIGMYQHEQRSLLVCVIRKSEVAEMQKILRSLEGTFCYVSETTDVYGSGFSRHK